MLVRARWEEETRVLLLSGRFDKSARVPVETALAAGEGRPWKQVVMDFTATCFQGRPSPAASAVSTGTRADLSNRPESSKTLVSSSHRALTNINVFLPHCPSQMFAFAWQPLCFPTDHKISNTCATFSAWDIPTSRFPHI